MQYKQYDHNLISLLNNENVSEIADELININCHN